jgi:hypothetical protein
MRLAKGKYDPAILDHLEAIVSGGADPVATPI